MTAREKIAYRFGDGTLSMDWYIQQRQTEANKLRRQASELQMKADVIEQEVRALCDVLRRVEEPKP